MFIQGFDGPWLSHPFWRSRFLLTDPRDLRKLTDADIEAVIIDDEKGVGPAVEPAPHPAHAAASGKIIVPASVITPIARATPGNASRSASDERARATAVMVRSKRVMKHVFDGARLGRAVRSEDVIAVVDDISASVQRNHHALIGITRLKTKDEYTYLHSVAVCALMVNFARHLGMEPGVAQQLGFAGLLHDIGKMAVPEPILNKPERLTDAEFAMIRSHPAAGAELLAAGEGVPQVAIDVCRDHHEKIDGTGYPNRLAGERISLPARMGAICDVYDALTSNRAYKEAWTPVEAVTAMWGWAGHFDPALLFRFLQSISVFPVGMLVRLRTNRLAIVLDNGRRASRPRVRAFYSTTEHAAMPPVDVVISDTLSDDQIVAVEDPATWRLGDWPALRDKLLAA